MRLIRAHLLSNLIRFCARGTQVNDRSIRSLLSSTMVRLYTTEMEPQLSPDLIRIMDQRLSAIEHRNALLQKLINQPEYSPEEFSRANKELRKLRDSMELIIDLRAKQKEIDGLRSLVSECSDDRDMLDMVVSELDEAMEEEKRLQTLLLKSLLPKDEADERDCILEVRAGTGGEEASLFAMDIFRMYERYSQKKGWKFEIVDITESDMKGYKVRYFYVLLPVIISISLQLCYSAAKMLNVIARKPVLQYVELVFTENLSSRVVFTGFSVFLSQKNLDEFTPALYLLPSFPRLMR
ncbi:hypothetical protein CARUB_v10023316mg [Capsella rubella]|uniref:Peptide chain release factor domain-containing protein n=1 Tax=Capsella rubella TaxID=81985 RepID=R0HPJ3_9BRAS|nr:hypothetical protein CARUB_v10023316mg [Capsella rubella]